MSSSIKEFQTLTTFAPDVTVTSPGKSDLYNILNTLNKVYSYSVLRAMIESMYKHLEDISTNTNPHRDWINKDTYVIDTLYEKYRENDTDGIYHTKQKFKEILFSWLFVDPRTEETDLIPVDIDIGFNPKTHVPNGITWDASTLGLDTVVVFEADKRLEHGAITTRLFGVKADIHNHSITVHNTLKQAFLGELLSVSPTVQLDTFRTFGRQETSLYILSIETVASDFLKDIHLSGVVYKNETLSRMIFQAYLESNKIIEVTNIGADSICIVFYPDDNIKKTVINYPVQDEGYNFIIRGTPTGIKIFDKDTVIFETDAIRVAVFTELCTPNYNYNDTVLSYATALDIYPTTLSNDDLQKVLGGLPE